MTYEQLKQKMDEAHYIYDETLATVLYVSLQLGRPLHPGNGAVCILAAGQTPADRGRCRCWQDRGGQGDGGGSGPGFGAAAML